MKLVVFTIVKNGMPFIPSLFFNLQATKLDWRWIVAEGSSLNTHCTSWCNQQEPGLSSDGTTEFLDLVKSHPRVTILRKDMWDGKLEMCNACLAEIKEPCVLIQMDADEIWRSDNIEKVVGYFDGDEFITSVQMPCRYFLGVNIVSTKFHAYGNNPGEWLRAWRFSVGDKFDRHEPPMLKQAYKGRLLNLQWMGADGFMFDHFAWWSENQAAFKEMFYGYTYGLQHWSSLQQNTVWPVQDLRKFLPWVGPGASADKLSS